MYLFIVQFGFHQTISSQKIFDKSASNTLYQNLLLYFLSLKSKVCSISRKDLFHQISQQSLYFFPLQQIQYSHILSHNSFLIFSKIFIMN